VLDEPTLGLDVVAKRAFLESLMYGNAAADCTVIYCSHQMEEIERVADNLIILERGQLKHMSAPEDFTARVTLWVADVPFKGPDPGTVPGLLEMQRLDGLHHYLVLDQDEGFAQFLRAAGARSIQSMPVSLDRAVNGFLAKNHAAPMASAGMSSAGMPSTGASPTRTPSRDTSR
jgi:ABC-2 type transport system ATP-binding protein